MKLIQKPTLGTWLRLAALLAIYMLLPLAAIPMEPTQGKSFVIMCWIMYFPITVIVLSVWDGARRGFNILWVICPFLFWLLPSFLYFTLIYDYFWGIIYTVLAMLCHSTAAFLTRNSRNHQPSEAGRKRRVLAAFDLFIRIAVGIAAGAAVGFFVNFWYTYASLVPDKDGNITPDTYGGGIRAVLVGVIVAVVVAVALSVANYRRLYREERMKHRLELAAQSQDLATKVHDSVSHALVQISILSDTKPGAPDTTDSGDLRQIHELSAQGLSEIRDLVQELQRQSQQWSGDGDLGKMPTGTSCHETTEATQQTDFAQTLQEFVDSLQRSDFTFDLQIRGNLAEIPSAKAVVLGECLREVGTNALKHADPSHPVILLLRIESGSIHLYCANQVSPQAPEFPSANQGLVGIRQRVEAHGGTVNTDMEDGTWSLTITL